MFSSQISAVFDLTAVLFILFFLRSDGIIFVPSFRRLFVVSVASIDRNNYFWTMPEELLLKRMCLSGSTMHEVAQHLKNRSDAAIMQKASELGLTLKNDKRLKADRPAIDECLRSRLEDGAEKGVIKSIAEAHNLPAWYVSRRAGQLGLTRPRLKEADWSPEEIAIADTYGEDGHVIVRKRLRLAGFVRTEGSVSMMLKRRQIELLAQPSMSARGVAEMMGVDGKTVVRWIESMKLKAKRVDDTWRIGHKDLRKWLLDHPTSFDLKKVRQVWFLKIMSGLDS